MTSLSYHADLDDLAAVLQGVKWKRNGKGLKALCPAHDDHNPSFDADLRDGKIFYTCRATCEQTEVTAALSRLGWPRGNTDRNKGNPNQYLVAIYRHAKTGAGWPVYRRDDPKKGKRIWGEKGHQPGDCEILLWPLGPDKRERQDLDDSYELAVVEGEKVARRLAEYLEVEGEPFTPVSWRGGAGKEHLADWSKAKGRRVTFLPDNDEPGLKAMQVAAQMAQEAGAASLRMADVSELPEKGDAADVDRATALTMLRSAKNITVDPDRKPATSPNPKDSPWVKKDWVSRTAEIPAARRLIDAHAERLLVVENTKAGRLRLLVMDAVGIWHGGLSTLYQMINDTEMEFGQEGFKAYRNDNIDLKTFGSISRWLRSTNNDKGRQAILQSVTGVGGGGWKWPTEVTRCTEEELDALTKFLGCANGVVDLKTGLVLPPSLGRTKRVTLTTGVEYVPTARSVDIDKLFSRLSQEEFRWFFEGMGYALRGQPSGRGYLLLGEPRGGKSSALAAIRGSLGDYSNALPEGVLTMEAKSDTGPRPELAPFTKLRIGTDSDLPPGVPISRSTFNRVTSGNDPIRVRKLYEDYDTGRRSVCTLLMSANYGMTPYFRSGADKAIYDRLRILGFPGTIPVADRDLDLERRVEYEMEARRAMLAQLINAGIGLTGPPEDIPSVATERERFRQSELGTAGIWLLSHVEVTNDPSDRFHANTLWALMVEAAKRDEAHSPADGAKKETVWERNRAWVMEQIKKLHSLQSQKKVRVHGKPDKGWDGAALLDCGSDCQTCSPQEELDVDETETTEPADAPAPATETTMPQNDRPGYSMVGGGHGAATITHEDICSECNSSVRPKHQTSHPTQARLFDGFDLVALGHAVRVIPLEAIRTTSIMANPQDDAEFREIVSRVQALAEAYGVTYDVILTHYLAELQIRRDHQYGRQRTLAVGAPRLN